MHDGIVGDGALCGERTAGSGSEGVVCAVRQCFRRTHSNRRTVRDRVCRRTSGCILRRGKVMRHTVLYAVDRAVGGTLNDRTIRQ